MYRARLDHILIILMTPHSAITMENISGADVVIQRKKLKIRMFIVLAVTL